MRAKIDAANQTLGTPTLAQLHDPAFATKQEVDSLLKFDAIRRPCREIAVNGFRENAPLYVPIFLERYSSWDAVAVRLIDKKITWGQAQQEWQNSANNFRTSMAKMDAFYGQQIAQAQQAEIQQRQQIAESLQRWGQQQQMISAMNRPSVTNTNCSTFGNTLDCTSRTQP